jgi:hypothetical protein
MATATFNALIVKQDLGETSDAIFSVLWLWTLVVLVQATL